MKTASYLTIHSSLDDTVKREHKFHVRSLVGQEAISEDYNYSIQLSTLERLTDSEIDRLMGNSITVAIGYLDFGHKPRYRYLNGVVYRVEELGLNRSPFVPDIWHYRIELGSWLRKLSFVKDCRIFQKNGTTVLQLIKDLLREYGLHDIRSDIRGSLPRKDLAVLYAETVAQFVCRLLRENQLIFRFEHSEDNHTLVISDDSTTFPVLSSQTLGKQDAVKRFCRKESHLPLKEIAEASFSWEQQPVKTVSRKVDTEKGRFGSYLYSGAFEDRNQGEEKVRKQGLTLESQKQGFKGESTIRGLQAGHIFELQAPALPDQHGKTFLIKELKIEATDQSYVNSFTVISANTPYFSPRNPIDDQPRISGPQTAIVVGEGDSGSVSTDPLGRIKVRFHWDGYAPKNSSNTSAYLRVAMPAAGSERGLLFNPRVGEEVVVDFEDGNPEKAYIIGSVYSKINPPPFAPNTKPFRSIIKNSSATHANQVVFDDKPNNEALELVARKRMAIAVNRNMKIDVKKNITIDAKAVTITSKTGVEIHAGKEINHHSLVTILNIATLRNTNTAGGNILNLAAAMVLQAAGGILTNLAGVLYANTSVLGITQSGEGKVDNASKLLLLNTASSVINAGEQTVVAKAGLAILNNAGTDTVNKGSKKNTKALMSTSEAGKFVVSGKTTVGPV